MTLRIRRGGGTGFVPPPPVLPTTGPTAGAQSVRDGAGPQTVTDPGRRRLVLTDLEHPGTHHSEPRKYDLRRSGQHDL